MGRERSRPLRPDWEEVKDGIMRQAVLRKFETHADNREVLLATSDELIGNAFPSLPATRASAGFQQPSSPTEHPCSGQTHCFRNLQVGASNSGGYLQNAKLHRVTYKQWTHCSASEIH